jgi:hypothetical protein
MKVKQPESSAQKEMKQADQNKKMAENKQR